MDEKEKYDHPSLPGFSQREIFEGMTPDHLADYILDLSQSIEAIELQITMAADVLEGAFGLTVVDVLTKREEQNGT